MCRRVNSFCIFILFFLTTAIMQTASAHDALSPEQKLGQDLFFDEDLSLKRNQACASCHDPDTGFVDPRNTVASPNPPPMFMPVSAGSVSGRFGTRNAPSAAYAAFSPFFHWDGVEGLYVGGQFWDGRANTLADQAAQPFLNPVEMAMPDKWAVVDRLRRSRKPDYVSQFLDIYGIDLTQIPDYPWSDSSEHTRIFPAGVLETYDRMTQAISAFEKTRAFTGFDSKFDYYLAGMTDLTPAEANGLVLFNTQAKCMLCHLSEPSVAVGGIETFPPLFTDFTYDNLGVPQNRYIPDFPIPPDLGLGGRPDIAVLDPLGQERGKFKVMTLRNIELTPPYAHNGVFETLEQIVHFYNTRDVLPLCDPFLGNTDPTFGTGCWPEPEVAQNVNTDELGDLGLNSEQEADLVAFLKTLTDGWGEKNGLAPLGRPPLPPLP